MEIKTNDAEGSSVVNRSFRLYNTQDPQKNRLAFTILQTTEK